MAVYWDFTLLRSMIGRMFCFCRRTYEDLRLFDKQLHRCIYDRKFSQLPELRKNELKDENILVGLPNIEYIVILVEIVDPKVSCNLEGKV